MLKLKDIDIRSFVTALKEEQRNQAKVGGYGYLLGEQSRPIPDCTIPILCHDAGADCNDPLIC